VNPDLSLIIECARCEIEGRPVHTGQVAAQIKAYARTIVWLSENWEPKKPKAITLVPSDAETRIKP
jgi:hypothetical protein